MEILDITGDHISKLSDEDLRILIVKLCEAELRRFNLPLSAVTAGGHQNAADGGIDVRVELPNSSSDLDFIPKSITGFQVKQQDMPAKAIHSEMRPHGELRSSIYELGSKNGAYVIVSGLGSTTDSILKKRKYAMQSAISDLPQDTSLTTDFYDRDRIARWIKSYPGIALWLREQIGEPLTGWRPYGNWAYGDSANSKYLLDDKCRIIAPQQTNSSAPLTVEQGIQAIRQILEKPHGIVRLVGLSGTGKTRLVQALFDTRIGNNALDRSIVIYVDQGNDHSPTPSARDMIHRCAANGLRTIVVVDNCNPVLHRDLAQTISTSGDLISLITVEYDVSDDEPEETQVFRLEPASEKNIEEILQRLKPNVSQIDRTRIAEFSGGNARIALSLARTVEHSDSLATLNDTELFHRLFSQRQNDSEALMKAAEVCSLVYSFDGETIEGIAAELSVLAELVNVTPQELYRQIGELRSRDLIQQRSKWRALLPHAIANRLARQALEKIHPKILTNTFYPSGRERLLKSFSRRLGYLIDSEQAKQIAEMWLGSGGILENPACLNELGIDMFINVAPLAPNAALTAIEMAASSDEGKTFLSPSNYERWKWCRLIRSIAYEAQYFSRAALLLARIVTDETESQNHNSARDSFKELFHLYLSGTHALVEARLAVVQQLLESEDKKLNACGLTALAEMLKNSHFTSNHDFTFGGRHRDFGWEPKTSIEVSAWFKAVTAFAMIYANSNSSHTPDIKQLFAQYFRGLWVNTGVCTELEELAKDFAAKEGWPDGWLAIREIIHFDLPKMSPQFAQRTRALEIKLRPKNDLEQKTRAYVLSNKQGYFCIVDTEPVGDDTQAWKLANNIVEDLGEEVASTPDVLTSLLPELLSSNNNMIWQFGHGLAKGASNIEQLWQQLHHNLTSLPENKRNYSLLRGFIEAANTRDPTVVSQLMDEALKDPVLSPVFPILQSSYPIDEAGAKRLILSIAQGDAPMLTYSHLMYGMVSDSIQLSFFREILVGIASLPNGYPIAIDIFKMRLHSLQSNKTPIDSNTSLLGRELLKLNEFQNGSSNHAYHVNEVAVACMVGDAASQDATTICTKLARALSDYHSSAANQFDELACTLFRLQPVAAIAVFLNGDLIDKSDNRQYKPLSYSFMFNRKSPVNAAPPELLMAWAKENPEIGLPRLAEEIHLFAKNGEHDSPSWSPIALEILESLPDRSVILDIFASRFQPRGVCSGSLADNLSPYLVLAEELQTHNDPLVASWAKKQIDLLNKKISEENERSRRVDESFE